MPLSVIPGARVGGRHRIAVSAIAVGRRCVRAPRWAPGGRPSLGSGPASRFERSSASAGYGRSPVIDGALRELGWNEAVDVERAAMSDPAGEPGRVARIDRKWCTVWRPHGEQLRLPAPEDLAVGDFVVLPETLDRTGARVHHHSDLA